ncbi:FkbM family methyltransferase [Methyloraptor flagellatus]|uniref:FkbM family methyltransferase n=1 Tax=Methyloraptor flagellatus TaxID=3162530 RepID=A0AAU7XFF2_9HYPH
MFGLKLFSAGKNKAGSSDMGRTLIRSNRGVDGPVVTGPYVRMAPGRYVVTFRVGLTEEPAGTADVRCGYLDVCIDCGNVILARTELFHSRLSKELREIHLAFDLDRETEVEFRVFNIGRAGLVVDEQRDVSARAPDVPDFTPMLPPGAPVPDAFFVDNAEHFRKMYENGARLAVVETGTIAQFGDVRFKVANPEDFQIAYEVFIVREYNACLRRRSTVFDIGMNVGLLSLFMASNPQVSEVHSFEPFALPRRRAAENFALNGRFADKITVHPFGLSDKDDQIAVAVSDQATISTSIRGRGDGVRTETIDVRAAADVLAPLFAAAKARGDDIVMKIDCEGAEFPIFESLRSASLFRSVTAIMLEWHRSWSPALSQDDLLAVLRAEGFIAFDRTLATDQFAGQILAVRAA